MNIAGGTHDQTQEVVKEGAIPHLIRLLYSTNFNVVEKAVWAFGNIIGMFGCFRILYLSYKYISGDESVFRDLCIQSGLLDALLPWITADIPITLLRTITWVLVNLCRNNDPPIYSHVVESILPKFTFLIQLDDNDITADVIWALSYLADSEEDRIQLVIESGLMQYCVPKLDESDINIVVAVLRLIGNVASGNNYQAQCVLDCDALKYMPALLIHQDETIKQV